MAKKLRYGIVGCGGCGCGKHLASYSRHADEIEFVAACDIVPEKAKAAAEKYGFAKTYTDYKEMFKKEKLDIVSVATPNLYHAPIAIAALQAGINVHSEKPMAINAEAAQAMVDAKNASGKKLMVGLNNRYTEISLFVKKYIDEGHLGDIYLARCGWHRRRGIPGKGGWFTTKALSGGGPLIDLGVHFFDLTLFLMGFPAPLTASGSTFAEFINREDSVNAIPEGTNNEGETNGICDVEDLATGFVRLANGASVRFEFSWASNIPGEDIYYELYGSKGGLLMRNGELTISSEVAGKLIDIKPKVRDTTGWGQNETRHFIDCIKNDLDVMSPPEEAVKMMQIIDAVYESAATGHEVVINPALV